MITENGYQQRPVVTDIEGFYDDMNALQRENRRLWIAVGILSAALLGAIWCLL